MEWHEEDGVHGLFFDDDEVPVAMIVVVVEGCSPKFVPHVGRAMLEVLGREPQFYDTIEDAKQIAAEMFANVEEVDEEMELINGVG